jgi:hypothetical protein
MHSQHDISISGQINQAPQDNNSITDKLEKLFALREELDSDSIAECMKTDVKIAIEVWKNPTMQNRIDPDVWCQVIKYHNNEGLGLDLLTLIVDSDTLKNLEKYSNWITPLYDLAKINKAIFIKMINNNELKRLLGHEIAKLLEHYNHDDACLNAINLNPTLNKKLTAFNAIIAITSIQQTTPDKLAQLIKNANINESYGFGEYCIKKCKDLELLKLYFSLLTCIDGYVWVDIANNNTEFAIFIAQRDEIKKWNTLSIFRLASINERVCEKLIEKDSLNNSSSIEVNTLYARYSRLQSHFNSKTALIKKLENYKKVTRSTFETLSDNEILTALLEINFSHPTETYEFLLSKSSKVITIAFSDKQLRRKLLSYQWIDLAYNTDFINVFVKSDYFHNSLEISGNNISRMAVKNYETCIYILTNPLANKLTGAHILSLITTYGDAIVKCIFKNETLKAKLYAADVIQLAYLEQELGSIQDEGSILYLLGKNTDLKIFFRKAIKHNKHLKSFHELLEGNILDLFFCLRQSEGDDSLIDIKHSAMTRLWELTSEPKYKTPKILAQEKEIAERKKLTIEIAQTTAFLHRTLHDAEPNTFLKKDFFSQYRSYDDIKDYSTKNPDKLVSICFELALLIINIPFSNLHNLDISQINFSFNVIKCLEENPIAWPVIVKYYPEFAEHCVTTAVIGTPVEPTCLLATRDLLTKRPHPCLKPPFFIVKPIITHETTTFYEWQERKTNDTKEIEEGNKYIGNLHL